MILYSNVKTLYLAVGHKALYPVGTQEYQAAEAVADSNKEREMQTLSERKRSSSDL